MNNKKENISEIVSAMGVNDSQLFPIVRMDYVKSRVSAIQLIMNRKYKTTTFTEGRKYIKVTRIR